MPPYYPYYLFAFTDPSILVAGSVFIGVLVIYALLESGHVDRRLMARFADWSGIAAAAGFFCVLLSPLLLAGRNYAFVNADDMNFVVSALTVGRARSSFLDVVPGGADFYSIAGSHALSLSRLYGAILSPPDMVVAISVINCFLAILFTFLLMRRRLNVGLFASWMATIFVGFSQGYWQGKLWDSHLTFLHGIALIPAALYYFDSYFETKWAPLVAILMGIAFGIGSVIVFYVIPPLVATIAIWGLSLKPHRWLRLFLTLFLLAGACSIVQSEYLLGIATAFPFSARSDVKILSVPAPDSIFLVLLFAGACVTAVLVWLVRRKQLPQTILHHLRVVWLALGILPLALYVLQFAGFSFRLRHFYYGNTVIWVVPVAFVFDAILRAVKNWNRTAGAILIAATLAIAVCGFGNLAIGSVVADTSFGYPHGGWNTIDRFALEVNRVGQSPVPRSIGYGSDPIVHMGPWLHGLPSVTSYNGLLNRNLVDYWNRVLAADRQAAPGMSGYTVILDNPQGINAIRLEAAANIGVGYVWSSTPLSHSMLSPLWERKGALPTCDHPSVRENLQNLGAWNHYVQCILTERSTVGDAYLYRIDTVRPMAYTASVVRVRRSGSEVSDSDSLRFIFNGNAIITASGAQDSDSLIEDRVLDRGNVTVMESIPGRMKIRFVGASPGFVVMNLTDNGNWRVTVDGVVRKYAQVNLAQIGLLLEKGEHGIAVAYCPRLRLRRLDGCD